MLCAASSPLQGLQQHRDSVQRIQILLRDLLQQAGGAEAVSPTFSRGLAHLTTPGAHRARFKPLRAPVTRMRVKKLPMILALHLKRFKYMEQLHRYTKLSYRVVFPLELRLFNTSGDAVNLDRMYDLVAVVVHCGRYCAVFEE